jgi:hypothetical protein
VLWTRQSTLKGGYEAARIDEAHDQFVDFHPAEQGAEAAVGVTGRVGLDLHEAVSRTVRQPAAAPCHARRPFPGPMRGPGRPANGGAWGADLEVGIRSRSSLASISIRPPAGPPPSRVSVQLEIGPRSS